MYVAWQRVNETHHFKHGVGHCVDNASMRVKEYIQVYRHHGCNTGTLTLLPAWIITGVIMD